MPEKSVIIRETENSLFGDKTYKRVEIKISPPNSFLPLTKLEEIIEENFPSIPRDKISIAFHSVENDYITLVLVISKK